MNCLGAPSLILSGIFAIQEHRPDKVCADFSKLHISSYTYSLISAFTKFLQSLKTLGREGDFELENEGLKCVPIVYINLILQNKCPKIMCRICPVADGEVWI